MVLVVGINYMYIVHYKPTTMYITTNHNKNDISKIL